MRADAWTFNDPMHGAVVSEAGVATPCAARSAPLLALGHRLGGLACSASLSDLPGLACSAGITCEPRPRLFRQPL